MGLFSHEIASFVNDAVEAASVVLSTIGILSTRRSARDITQLVNTKRYERKNERQTRCRSCFRRRLFAGGLRKEKVPHISLLPIGISGYRCEKRASMGYKLCRHQSSVALVVSSA